MHTLEILVTAVAMIHFASGYWLTSSDSCYYPDGTLAPSLKACNARGSGHSSCCYNKLDCSDSGYCHGSSGILYRGGCTDETWGSGKCNQLCANVHRDTSSDIMVIPGDSKDVLAVSCMSRTSHHYGACDSKLVMQARLLARQEPATSISATVAAIGNGIATATATPTTVVSYPPHDSHTPSAKTVGLAVGIPLGLIAMISSFGCYYLWIKSRSVNRSTAFKDLGEDQISVAERHIVPIQSPPDYENGKPVLKL